MDETWAGSLRQIFIDDGGFRYTATQRGDGEAPPEDRALPAASQQLREPLRDRDARAAGDGETADLCAAPALPANQGQAVQQASAAPGQRGAVRAEVSRQRQRGGERRRGGAEPEQHPHRGKWCPGTGVIRDMTFLRAPSVVLSYKTLVLLDVKGHYLDRPEAVLSSICSILHFVLSQFCWHSDFTYSKQGVFMLILHYSYSYWVYLDQRKLPYLLCLPGDSFSRMF